MHTQSIHCVALLICDKHLHKHKHKSVNCSLLLKWEMKKIALTRCNIIKWIWIVDLIWIKGGPFCGRCCCCWLWSSTFWVSTQQVILVRFVQAVYIACRFKHMNGLILITNRCLNVLAFGIFTITLGFFINASTITTSESKGWTALRCTIFNSFITWILAFYMMNQNLVKLINSNQYSLRPNVHLLFHHINYRLECIRRSYIETDQPNICHEVSHHHAVCIFA